MKTIKILDFFSGEICMFCGEDMKLKFDEHRQYHECNCKDAVLCRKLDKEIENLKRQYPLPKFAIEKVKALIKIEKK